jgi:hypothetical protein
MRQPVKKGISRFNTYLLHYRTRRTRLFFRLTVLDRVSFLLLRRPVVFFFTSPYFSAIYVFFVVVSS